MAWKFFGELVLIQPSAVKSPVRKFSPLVGTATWSSAPSRLNAGPTIPAPNVAPLTKVPWFGPKLSSALLSARHQLTTPAGRFEQTCTAPVSGTTKLVLSGSLFVS